MKSIFSESIIGTNYGYIHSREHYLHKILGQSDLKELILKNFTINDYSNKYESRIKKYSLKSAKRYFEQAYRENLTDQHIQQSGILYVDIQITTMNYPQVQLVGERR